MAQVYGFFNCIPGVTKVVHLRFRFRLTPFFHQQWLPENWFLGKNAFSKMWFSDNFWPNIRQTHENISDRKPITKIFAAWWEGGVARRRRPSQTPKIGYAGGQNDFLGPEGII